MGLETRIAAPRNTTDTCDRSSPQGDGPLVPCPRLVLWTGPRKKRLSRRHNGPAIRHCRRHVHCAHRPVRTCVHRSSYGQPTDSSHHEAAEATGCWRPIGLAGSKW